MDGLDKITMTVSLRLHEVILYGSRNGRADPKRELYLKSIVPIGVLFSGSLILSNTAYLSYVVRPGSCMPRVLRWNSR